MADIELIVKRPEEVRVAITRMGLLRIPNEMQKKVDRAIQRGTPLPKGHGRLIDADDIRVIELEDSLHIIRHEKGDEIDVYIDAPTIIEADKEQKEPKRDNFDQQAKWLLNGLKIQINALADEKGNQLDLEDVMKIIEANKERE